MGKSLVILWMSFSSLVLHSQTTAAFKDRGSDNTIDSLQQLLNSARTGPDKANWHTQIANSHFFKGQYLESIDNLKRALELIAGSETNALEPGIYNSLGRSYCALGDLSRGMECYYKALRISEKSGDKKGMASSFQYVGTIFLDQRDDSMGLVNISVASELNLETGNKFGYAQNNNTIAEIFLRQGKLHEGMMKLKRSLSIYQEPGAPTWGIPWTFEVMGIASEFMGDSALSKGNRQAANSYYEVAMKNFSIALNEFEGRGVTGGVAEQHLFIGALQIKLNNLSLAKEHIQKGLGLAAETGTKEMITKGYLCLSRIDSLEGNYESAFRNFKRSILYRDSVFNSEESRKIAVYKTRYEIEKKEEEIKLLAAENNLKTTIAEKQEQQKLFAYAAILLVILLSSYAFYRYRIRKKAELEQAKLKDRLHISQELHDDIGSTLSSISVYTQVAQKLNEKSSKEELQEMLGKINHASFEMISEMNDIVWSIHPKNDSMEKIILRMDSYARPMLMAKNISFKLKYDPVILSSYLEMEKRKNFYLVFKEAVNNAFKYSGCSEIITHIFQSKGRMEMHVDDNGIGFDVRQEITGNKMTLSGNGLRNMKMRAEEMRGDLQVTSVIGNGTSVKLSFPIT